MIWNLGRLASLVLELKDFVWMVIRSHNDGSWAYAADASVLILSFERLVLSPELKVVKHPCLVGVEFVYEYVLLACVSVPVNTLVFAVGLLIEQTRNGCFASAGRAEEPHIREWTFDLFSGGVPYFVLLHASGYLRIVRPLAEAVFHHVIGAFTK